MDIEQIIAFFLSSGFIITALIFLAKFIINKIGEIQILKYKQSLENETEQFKHMLSFETEKFKQELNKETIEHQIKYAKLYEKRGQVIKQIYNLLYELEIALASLTSMFQGPEWATETERDKIVETKISNLKTYLERNRIFFSETLCNDIEGLLEDTRKITVEIYTAKKNQQYNDNLTKAGVPVPIEKLLQPTQQWRALDTQVQINIKDARLELAQAFRKLISVE